MNREGGLEVRLVEYITIRRREKEEEEALRLEIMKELLGESNDKVN